MDCVSSRRSGCNLLFRYYPGEETELSCRTRRKSVPLDKNKSIQRIPTALNKLKQYARPCGLVNSFVPRNEPREICSPREILAVVTLLPFLVGFYFGTLFLLGYLSTDPNARISFLTRLRFLQSYFTGFELAVKSKMFLSQIRERDLRRVAGRNAIFRNVLSLGIPHTLEITNACLKRSHNFILRSIEFIRRGGTHTQNQRERWRGRDAERIARRKRETIVHASSFLALAVLPVRIFIIKLFPFCTSENPERNSFLQYDPRPEVQSGFLGRASRFSQATFTPRIICD